MTAERRDDIEDFLAQLAQEHGRIDRSSSFASIFDGMGTVLELMPGFTPPKRQKSLESHFEATWRDVRDDFRAALVGVAMDLA